MICISQLKNSNFLNYKNEFILLGFLIFWNFADIVTTLIFLDLGYSEGNIFMAYIMETKGLLFAMCLKLFIMFSVILMYLELLKYYRKKFYFKGIRNTYIFIIFITLFYTLIGLINYYVSFYHIYIL
jgi:hypothetical protein